jgi:hypothetical protein
MELKIRAKIKPAVVRSNCVVAEVADLGHSVPCKLQTDRGQRPRLQHEFGNFSVYELLFERFNYGRDRTEENFWN